MFSVTRRIEIINQPRGGYVNPNQFEIQKFQDGKEINSISVEYKTIQGLVVDYLTRFMSGCSKEKAFEVSVRGAGLVFEAENAKRLLNNIKGLDSWSIYSACQLVGYDVVVRRGAGAFSPVEKINPEDAVIQNIIIMVQRALKFLEKYGPVTSYGFTFEGGYTKIVSSGDGDLLTRDTLWDFKVSQKLPSSRNTLQLLMYYILGIHSIHKEFQNIRKIGIFNPELNMMFELKLSQIPDAVFKEVSREVIGLKIPDDPKQWRLANGTDKNVLRKVIEERCIDTGFNPEKYKDGIHNISVEDYWSYFCKISQGNKPKFKYVKEIKFLKNKGFIMFVSISPNGVMSILQGGKKRCIKQSLEYYYYHMSEYGNLVLQRFSSYWSALYGLAEQVREISPDKNYLRKRGYAEYVKICKKWGNKCLKFETWYEQEKDNKKFEGKVHGCVVDLDYFNHIFLNPFDGKLVSYTSSSKYSKDVYKSIGELIKEQRPEMLVDYSRRPIQDTSSFLTTNSVNNSSFLELNNNDGSGDIETEHVTDVSMYRISDKFKELQLIYEYGLIVVWYDSFFPYYGLEERKSKNKEKNENEKSKTEWETNQHNSLVGMSAKMDNGMIATVIEDNGDKNITVRYEDGEVYKYISRDYFRKRCK